MVLKVQHFTSCVLQPKIFIHICTTFLSGLSFGNKIICSKGTINFK